MHCTRCVYDDTLPGITFDSDGVCSYCHTHAQLTTLFPADATGQQLLRETADNIRQAGKSKPFDCIVGVSGGCDSTYLLYITKEIMGLRPLAVHFDNTWNSDVAVQNMYNVTKALNVPLETYTVDSAEYDDLYRAFLQSGVPDIEAQTDIGLASVLNRAAEKHRIQYVIEGHNFRTEGLFPLGWLYMDGKYIQSIHKAYGTLPLKTYPNMTLTDQLRWMLVKRIRKIRPLWYMDYNKEEIKDFLHKTFDWQWYGGHHLENKFTTFFHSYFMPHRYGIDTRVVGLAAMVRTGKLSRAEALEALKQPFHMGNDVLETVQRRLGLNNEALAACMERPRKTYRDYTTYKQTFEHMRPFFWLMAKMRLIPYSFYVKYTRPDTTQPLTSRPTFQQAKL